MDDVSTNDSYKRSDSTTRSTLNTSSFSTDQGFMPNSKRQSSVREHDFCIAPAKQSNKRKYKEMLKILDRKEFSRHSFMSKLNEAFENPDTD